jgi:5-(carboxyamino)imidazole ribonucleotide mutase
MTDDGLERALVSIAMGSRSDLETLQPALDLLGELHVPYEARVVSAHRTPSWMFEYAQALEARGIEVVIAAAGGAAHLPGMLASLTLVPVLGVPVNATQLQGVDALLSIVQMPRGVAVGTLAIGAPGAFNAGMLAAQILANSRPELRARLQAMRSSRADAVLADRVIR